MTWFIIPLHLRLSIDYFLISVRILQGYARQVRRPRCIILVPTRDLARQILSNIKDLSHFSKVSLYHMTIFHPSVLFSLFLLKPSSMFALLTTALSSAQWRKSHLIWTTWSISLRRGMSRVDFISFVQDCSALSISLSSKHHWLLYPSTPISSLYLILYILISPLFWLLYDLSRWEYLWPKNVTHLCTTPFTFVYAYELTISSCSSVL